MRSLRVFLACVVVLVFVAVHARGQGASTATVVGTIMDQKRAAVPGATVELANLVTNETRKQTTGDTGSYIFVSVAPGDYRITVKREGFRTTIVGPVTVQVGKSATVDALLEVGTLSQTVEVQAGAGVELQTLDASVGTVLQRNTLDNLPSLARDATALLLLQPLVIPGFNSPGSPNATGEGDNTGGQVGGARSDQNTFLLDGGDASDSTAGSGQYSGTNFTATPRAVVPTPVESLEEFRVVTNNSGASFSRSAGGEVQMVTRRGGSQFHGAVYEYLQNDVLNANTWTRNSVGQKNPALRDNRFGGRFGGPIWRDKTFFFAHYEGRRFVSSADIDRRVPSEAMKVGILHFRDATGKIVAYNLNPTATVDPLTGQPVLPSGLDPRNLGLAPAIAKVWALEPKGNQPFGAGGDGLNTFGFTGPVAIPLTENFGVIRLDHVFNSKWQLMGSYRYGKTEFSSPVQVDIGGLLPGDNLGQPKSTAQRPLAPRYLVVGLTGQLTSHLTSDFRFDWLRHWWEWATFHPFQIPAPLGFPQPSGLAAALSIGGEGIRVGMQPINVDTQNARSRLWNGKDYNFFENLSWVKSNHLIQFGGRAGSQRFFHRRDDKVVGGLTSPVFTVGRLPAGSGITGIPIPATIKSADFSRWRNDYAAILGMVDRAQQLFTRGPDFSPNPPGTPLLQHTVVNSYALYISDSWRLKPSLTITAGLNWGVQLPPFEQTGEATMMVYHDTGKIVTGDDYIAQRKAAALAGKIFNPQLDFIPIRKTGRKYPYDPDWTNFGPRIAMAWNPSYSQGFLGKLFGERKAVLRGGYGRVYDRINGVGIVMIPALGIGFGNNLRCKGPRIPSGGVVACISGATPLNSFRIGADRDGTVVPLPSLARITPPLVPGSNSPFETLDFRIDPKRKIGYADTFDLTLQRELPGNLLLEIGYMGNYSHQLYQGFALNQVPYMTMAGGQSFAQAFSAIANQIRNGQAVKPQPWFETVLGPGGTLATVNDNGSDAFELANVFDVWDNLTFPASMLTRGSLAGGGADQTQIFDSYIIGSNGRSNYNAGFVSLHKRTSAGLTFDFNYTFSHAFDQIGQNQESLNESSDAFNLDRDYGSAQFDRRHTISTQFTYDLPFGRGRFSTGNWANKIIGGWNVSGVWVFGTGLPLDVGNSSSCEEYGQGPVFGNCSAYIPIKTTFYNSSVHRNPNGTLNAFGDRSAVTGLVKNFRTPDLLLDARTGRGFVRSLPRWSADFGLSKTTKITERMSTRFGVQMTNVFNHPSLNDPVDPSSGVVDLATPSAVGVLNKQYNAPRFIQFALRFDF